MALNTANAGARVLLFNGERIFIYCDDVEFSIDCEQGNVPQFKGNKKGRIYLTSHRTVFLPKASKVGGMESFAMPFHCMREVDLEQPVFGANYIKGKVVPEPNGNWEGRAKFKLWFNSGGAIEFGQAMLNAARLASRNAANSRPPVYTPPQQATFCEPPPNYYAGMDSHYTWVPHTTFPTAPPVSGVCMTTAPPPYVGVDPPSYNESVQNVPPPLVPTAPAAYYNPSNPHTIYQPNSNGASQPPPYPPQYYPQHAKSD